MELIADLISQLHVEHQAHFRCADASRVKGSVRSATAGGLCASLTRYDGFGYDAHIGPDSDPHAVVVLQGDGVSPLPERSCTSPAEMRSCLRPDRSHVTSMHNVGLAIVQVPRAVVRRLAEEATGLPAADLRFGSMPPVSAARQAAWARTAGFICHELVSSGITEVSPLMSQEMTHLATAGLLETFPNTTMTVAYTAGPGWVPPAAVRRAAAFIDAHADQPITLADIAAAAGTTARAVRQARSAITA